jgi:hypothetical protein
MCKPGSFCTTTNTDAGTSGGPILDETQLVSVVFVEPFDFLNIVYLDATF